MQQLRLIEPIELVRMHPGIKEHQRLVISKNTQIDWDEYLDFLNKKVTVKQNIEAILCCKRNKIICDASFMIGLPTETIKEIIETKNLIKKYSLLFEK